MSKKIFIGVVGVIGVLGVIGLQSCNVTRTITTQSQYYQKGDTTCTLHTSMDGKQIKKYLILNRHMYPGSS